MLRQINTKSTLFTWIFVMMLFSFQCRWRSSFCLDGEAYWDIVLLFPRLLRQFPPPSMISTQRWQTHGPVNLCNGPLYRSTDGMTSHGRRVSIFWLFQFSSMWIYDLEWQLFSFKSFPCSNLTTRFFFYNCLAVCCDFVTGIRADRTPGATRPTWRQFRVKERERER